MNERIGNNRIYVLAKEAGLIEFEQLAWNPELGSPTYESVAKARKFAELLIQECVSKCEFVADMATITNTGEMARKTKATADSCATMIKQHFGI